LGIIANFKDDSFYPQIRKKYFTMIDWFSFVGGILGLFFGFSFLSAFEIIFHAWMLIVKIGGCKRFWNKDRFFRIKQFKISKSIKYFKYFENFMKNSTVHSFRYIFGNDLKILER